MLTSERMEPVNFHCSVRALIKTDLAREDSAEPLIVPAFSGLSELKGYIRIGLNQDICLR